MATAIFRVVNPSGNLIADRNGMGLNYIGKATFGSTTPKSSDGENGSAGYSTYTFTTSSALVVPFITVPTSRTVYFVSMTYATGAWTFTIYCGGSTTDALGLETQYGDAEVFVFGRLTAATGMGLKMRDDAGTLTHVYTDTDGRPLQITGYLSVTDAALTDRSIPTVTKLAVCGFPSSYRTTSADLGGGFFRNRIYEYGWLRGTAANTLALNDVVSTVAREDAPSTPIPPGSVVTVMSSEVFILDANGLT